MDFTNLKKEDTLTPPSEIRVKTLSEIRLNSFHKNEEKYEMQDVVPSVESVAQVLLQHSPALNRNHPSAYIYICIYIYTY
mgnify:CR=1 FL=1